MGEYRALGKCRPFAVSFSIDARNASLSIRRVVSGLRKSSVPPPAASTKKIAITPAKTKSLFRENMRRLK